MSEFDAHTLPIETRLAAIAPSGFVTAEEVLFLQRAIFIDGIVNAHEADALIGLGKRAPDGDPEWAQFFAETICDFYLHEEEPHGYLSADQFARLRERIGESDGLTALELTLLVKLQEVALQTPKALSPFTGDAIKQSILNRAAPSVSKDDLALLKRWLFAVGGDGNVAITRAEAEVLFEINDGVRDRVSAPGWGALFSSAIVNHLMADLGYKAPSREAAMSQAAFIHEQSPDTANFFARMLRGIFSAQPKEESIYTQKARERDASAAAAEEITPDEAAWLIERLGRHDALDENERALIERLKSIGADLPEEIKALIEKAA